VSWIREERGRRNEHHLLKKGDTVKMILVPSDLKGGLVLLPEGSEGETKSFRDDMIFYGGIGSPLDKQSDDFRHSFEASRGERSVVFL
jgi:hypothetical protein